MRGNRGTIKIQRRIPRFGFRAFRMLTTEAFQGSGTTTSLPTKFLAMKSVCAR
ncbi:hypothetical protein J2046_001237 [Rhizobium petrolearium]|nr:hypothetical protein [Neorhizobium petrolearium]